MTHDEYRMKLWTDVAVAVARSENCRDTYRPGQWADKVLDDFDRTFPKPPNFQVVPMPPRER